MGDRRMCNVCFKQTMSANEWFVATKRTIGIFKEKINAGVFNRVRVFICIQSPIILVGIIMKWILESFWRHNSSVLIWFCKTYFCSQINLIICPEADNKWAMKLKVMKMKFSMNFSWSVRDFCLFYSSVAEDEGNKEEKKF